MSATDESFTLTVTRVEGVNRQHATREIQGDGPFIVQQVDVLLADPALIGFTLARRPAAVYVGMADARQTGDSLPAMLAAGL